MNLKGKIYYDVDRIYLAQYIWVTSGVLWRRNEEQGSIKGGKGNISFWRRYLTSWTPSLPRSVKRFIISCKAVESPPQQFFLLSAVFHMGKNRNIFLKKFQIYEVHSGRKRRTKTSKRIKSCTMKKRETGSPTIGTCSHDGRQSEFVCHISIFDVLPNFHINPYPTNVENMVIS
jgi:hypothetical protein